MYTAAQWTALFQALLAPGDAWNRQPGTVMTGLLQAYGDGFGRIDSASDALRPEANPLTAVAFLTDWEANLGLPDLCIGPLDSIAARQQAAFDRHTDSGGEQIERFQKLAASLGYAVRIVERWQRQYGDAMMGTGYGDVSLNFTWEIHTSAAQISTWRRYGSALTGGFYASWVGSDALECELRKYAPAHTQLIFVYHAKD